MGFCRGGDEFHIEPLVIPGLGCVHQAVSVGRVIVLNMFCDLKVQVTGVVVIHKHIALVLPK